MGAVSLTLLSVAIVARSGEGFNVDVATARIHGGSVGSYFGFSVDIHRAKDAYWLLVGAPKANATPPSQPGVVEGGAVFRCAVETSHRHATCLELVFDTKGDRMFNESVEGAVVSRAFESKSGQWFGATVRSEKRTDGDILACAPRYVYRPRVIDATKSGRSAEKKFVIGAEPVGTCYIARRNFSKIYEYSPGRTNSSRSRQLGFGQVGFSAALTTEKNVFYAGAVGTYVYNWIGELYMIDTALPVERTVFRDFITKEVFGPSHYMWEPGPTTPIEDQEPYFGYSMAAGDLDGDGRANDVAVAAPRAANFTGKVLMYKPTQEKLVAIGQVSGRQLGAYFGYCVVVVDVDGDALDDLVVGAPFYTNYSNAEGKFETGRLYVFYQGGEKKFSRTETIDGQVNKARFGLSATSLDDINLDGFKDVAVGAPYDAERGAVYIYHGSAKGLKTKASQVIHASQVSGALNTFGFSLAGGLDVDDNGYPDLLAGAYESDRVVLLRSRPIPNVTVRMDHSSPVIDTENRNCLLKDGRPVACTALVLCLHYSGVGVDDALNVRITLNLDVRSSAKGPRLSFVPSEVGGLLNRTLTLIKGQQFCSNHTVYVRPSAVDKLTTVESEVRCWLLDDGRGRSLAPVLQESPIVASSFVRLLSNCGRDGRCVPDLRLTAVMNQTHFLAGSTGRLRLNANVTNNGEDAFNATFYLTLPANVDYSKSDNASCSLDGRTVRCALDSSGGVLAAGRSTSLALYLRPNRHVVSQELLQFRLTVNSTDQEKDGHLDDNELTVNVSVEVRTGLYLKGVSDPAVVRLTANSSDDGAINVVHVYEVGNRGPSDLLQPPNLFILWPHKTFDGQLLLDLTEHPAECASSGFESFDQCDGGRCIVLHCSVGRLAAKEKPFVLTVRAMIVAATVNRAEWELVKISSEMVAIHDDDEGKTTIAYASTELDQVGRFPRHPGVVPKWKIVMSAGGGAALLAVLVCVLYKLGFFVRKRPPKHLNEQQRPAQQQNAETEFDIADPLNDPRLSPPTEDATKA